MPYKHLIYDPLQPNKPIETERKELKPGVSGFGKTADAQLAKEVKQRRPWAIVREYEDNNYGKATRPTFTMPAMPWKFDRERQIKFIEQFNEYYRMLNSERSGESPNTETTV